MKWKKHCTYKEITKHYVNYVRTKYGSCCIVFDGYDQGPSIKDHEHVRRVHKACADIQLAESMRASVDQQIFLSNMKNKSQFITLLSHCLRADGHIVNDSTGDADTMIVASALQFASQGNATTVVADDTDVLILLMYHWKENMADVYFLSEARKSQKKGLLVWKIHKLVMKAGEAVIPHLLFVHAWSGCDTVSAIFGQGKTNLLKKLKESEELKDISVLMSDPQATAEQIGEAGIRVLISMYGGKCRDSLTGLRYAKFMEMVASSRTSLNPQKLPPTERVGLGGIAVFSHGTIKEIIPSNAGNTAINCACAAHRVASCILPFLVMASGQQLTEKCGTKSAVWKYFSLIADDSGGGSQQDNPVCRICGVQV